MYCKYIIWNIQLVTDWPIPVFQLFHQKFEMNEDPSQVASTWMRCNEPNENNNKKCAKKIMCVHLYLLQSHLPVMIILIVYLMTVFSFVPFKSRQQRSEKPKPSSSLQTPNDLPSKKKKKLKRRNQKRKYRKNQSHAIHIIININCLLRFFLAEKERANHLLFQL